MFGAPATEAGDWKLFTYRAGCTGDIPEILKIDEESYLPDDLWTAKQYKACLGAEAADQFRLTVCYVAPDGEVAGYILTWGFHIVRLAVAMEYRGQGLGTNFINMGKARLKLGAFPVLTVAVHERAERAIRWFAKRGFRGARINRLAYTKGSGDHSVVMVYDLRTAQPEAAP